MSDAYDFSTAPAQSGDLIPAGTVARLRMTIKPGSAGPGGWLTRSKTSDAVYINAEFTVMTGQFARRKIWQNLTVEGGKLNDAGKSSAGEITRATLRAILESARGILPKDEGDAAKAARRVGGYGDFDGMEFVAKIGIEPAKGDFKERNKLDVVVTPDKPTWKEHSDSSVGPSASPPAHVAQQAAKPAGNKPSWL